MKPCLDVVGQGFIRKEIGMESEGHKSTFLERLAWGCGGLPEALSQTVFSLSFPFDGTEGGVS
jgi:hypothetical protein